MVFSQEDVKKINKAGEIHKKVVSYTKTIIKPGMKLLDLANRIDEKILDLKGKPAFPVNLSVNEVAAHATPAWNSEEVAKGLLKIDIGVHVDGFVADSAFSVDLEDSEENEKLISAAEAGLKAGLDKIGVDVNLSEIGGAVEKAIDEFGFTPIHNLSGHQIERFDLHAGLNIPNYNNKSSFLLKEGQYAIEPFATNGHGRVKDGKPSGIYKINGEGSVRDIFAREVLDFILEEYNTLPFCSRWIYNKFGARGLLALRQMEHAGVLHQYPQLVESNGGIVSQAEHTVVLFEGKKIVTTQS